MEITDGSMERFFEKRFRVYSHELPRFVWLSAVCFVIFCITALFRNYVDTAFLKRYGPDYIPWMLLINGLLTFVVMEVSDRLSVRLPEHRLLGGFLAAFSAAVFVLYAMVREGYSIAYPLLYQGMGLLDSVLFVYIWNLAGDLFDPRQGRRIFPLITASQLLGAAVGSFGTSPLTKLLGEDQALLVFAVICIGVATYVFAAGSGGAADLPTQAAVPDRAKAKKRLGEVPSLMRQYPIVRYLVVTGLVPNILLPIFSYQFSVIANAAFGSERTLIAFFSWFRGVTTLGSMVALLFVGRLYSRLGLPNASLVQPLNFAALFAALAGYFNIVVAAYGQLSSILIQRAVAGPVNKILYAVVPPNIEAWSRYFVRGTVLKVGLLAGSLLIIGLKPILDDPRKLAYPAVVLALYWTVETLIFRKEYKRILKQVIVGRRPYFDPVYRPQHANFPGQAQQSDTTMIEGAVRKDLPGESLYVPDLDRESALRLLDAPDRSVRAQAAAFFGANSDARAVRSLVRLLGDPDDQVRNAAIDTLIRYPKYILPFLEASLLRGSSRLRQGILEVVRLSPNIAEFETTHLLQRALTETYTNLIVIRRLRRLHDSPGAAMLAEYLEEANEDILTLIFYGLSVYHADMRLVYQALRSDTSAIAVELVETSMSRELVPYLMPLIEDIPLNEKIEKGRRLFLLIRHDDLERLLTFLILSDDPVIRMLALATVADLMPDSTFVPVVESCLEDENTHVRQVAQYAWAKAMNEEAPMPPISEMINKVKSFSLFEGLGIRELHAIATVISEQIFEPGDTIMREGEETGSIFLIRSGRVAVHRRYGTSAAEKRLEAKEGDFLGFVGMLTGLPTEVTCVATERTETLVLPKVQFLEILRIYPQIGLNLCRFAALRFRDVYFLD